ncbi:type VI secretion system protein ImpL [Izhakiella capsodis]|uniref:Type VI secretion system protein ImpL n=1 Tax=Izhakiella capsodis TaxID=1367852 RepID=A0A1I5A2S2_9GAMM|nr:type VI secretion system membrane subunit TssM [Izhakiella capsodis]SFN56825.1 type VI secretion system protein ImpL [Izhakiella capsodis]
MSVFNRLFSGQGLKRFLLIAFFCLLGAAIWFLGPMLGVGDVRPLEPIDSRIILLFTLFLLFLICWLRLPVFISIALILSVSIWIIGPYLVTGSRYPLKDMGVRLAIIIVILTLTLLYSLWCLLRAMTINPALLDRFIKSKPQVQQSDNDQKMISAIIKQGIRYMERIHRTAPLWQRFLFINTRQRFPWFLVMGTPACGKTTMLFSSGQEFPLPEQLNRKDKENPPTESCECLFTNDAIFLDTAGKYTQVDDGSQKEWDYLAQALRKHQLECNFSGVILALSAADILNRTTSELLSISATLRARLYELRQQTGEHFPVYLTITKLDLLTGFEEYFRNLTAAEREQIWGVTLPWQQGKTITTDELKTTLDNEFSLLEERISSVMYLRLQEEYDVSDRKNMYAFPQDFHLLAQKVIEVIRNIFIASRYDDTQFNSTLRGVYFNSSCQAGSVRLLNNSTLLRKWTNLVENDNPTTPSSLLDKKDDEGLLNHSFWGKSYFLNSLFRDVIVKDRGLAGYSVPLQSKFMLKNIMGHTLIWGGILFLISGLSTSYYLNRDYLKTIEVRVDNLDKQAAYYIKNPGEKLLPLLLDKTQLLSSYDDLDISNPDLGWRYGLYTGSQIFQGADKLYHYFLQHYLLTQIETESVKALNDAIQNRDEDEIWNELKLYLILAGQGDRKNDWMIKAIADQWEKSNLIQFYKSREQFLFHLNNIFNDPQWNNYIKKPDIELIKSARSILNQKSSTMRIWQQLKRGMMAEYPDNVTLTRMTGEDSHQIFTLEGSALNQQGIPGIYTRSAWNHLVKKKFLTDLVTLQREDDWVSGRKVQMSNPFAQREEIMKLYFQEYTSYWQSFLANIRLSNFSYVTNNNPDMPLNIALLRTLSVGNSPLVTLLNNVVYETTLAPNDNKILDGIDLKMNRGRVMDQAQNIAKKVSENEQQLVKKNVDANFSALRFFVKGSGPAGVGGDAGQTLSGTGLARLMKMLNEQYTRLVIYNDEIKNGDIPPTSEASSQLIAESRTWPDPIRNIVSPLLTRSNAKMKSSAIQLSVDSIDKGPGATCRNLLAGRYPFSDSEKNVHLADFERFFSSGGIVDSWFREHLAGKVDTSSYPWRFKGTTDSKGLAFFENVDSIRNAFLTANEGKKLALSFSASIRYLSPSITQLNMNMDGDNFDYSHGPLTTHYFTWPGNKKGTIISMVAHSQQARPAPVTSSLPKDHWDALRWLNDKSQPIRTKDASASGNLIYRGPWALLRWLDAADSVRQQDDGSLLLSWKIGPGRVDIQIDGLNESAQLPGELLRKFRCPGSDFGR